MRDASGPRMPAIVQNWLQQAVEAGASDLHLVPDYPPTMRLHGQVRHLKLPDLDATELDVLLRSLLSPERQEKFEALKNLDFAVQLETPQGLQRFRANYFLTGEATAACFRIIPRSIPDFQWTSFPFELADRLAHFRNGLVLISGVTGSGKTTTLALIVDLLCKEGGYRIITVEEPIEYLFAKTANSVITQREVGTDVLTFADGLKYGLRQDPDVILVGEIRDRETAQMALSAAETGHLVLATMHTRDAKGAISRYSDLFSQGVQNEIRAQLSTSLRAVVSQHLLPARRVGDKRELALEILMNTSPVASAIRTGKLESIDNNILTGRSDGMLTLSESVRRLYQAGKISQETAEQFVTDKTVLHR